MKKLFATVIIFLLNIKNIFALTESDIKPTVRYNANVNFAKIFAWLKGEVVPISLVIIVGTLVFIGIRIVIAKGNPEEFKKAWIHLVYVIVGIFFVFAAIGIVTLFANLGKNFFN